MTFIDHWLTLIKKILPTCLFFSSICFAFDLEHKQIRIPENVMFIGDDISAKKENGYVYEIDYKYFEPGKIVKVQNNQKYNSIEGFLETLFYSYANKDKNLLFSLFSKDGLKLLKKIPQGKFEIQQNLLSKIISPKIQYVLKHNNGFIVSWYDESFASARKIFIAKEDGLFKMFPFHADKDDHFFANVNLYLNSSPFNVLAAKIENTFIEIKNGQEKKMSFNISRVGNYIHLFKAEDKKIRMSLRDNYFEADFPLNDISKKDKHIEVVFKGENFKDLGKHELLYLESTYPMSFIRKQDLKFAKKLIIIKKE